MITHRWLLAITLGALALGAGACNRTPAGGENTAAATADSTMASDNTMGAENAGASATNAAAANDASAGGAASQ